MPSLPPPADDERAAILGFVDQQHTVLRAAAYGLTDEQLRSTPTRSALSVGGLLKHVAVMETTWIDRVVAAPREPERDQRPGAERSEEYGSDFVVRQDQTLASILDRFAQVTTRTLATIPEVDLDTFVPVPRDAPWFPQDIEGWNVRWVFFHLIEELARHAGHADILRECIDGATAFELLAAMESRPATSWLTPWTPEG